EAVQYVANFRPTRLLLGDRRPVNECAALLPVLDVALLLEDSDGGENRVIGKILTVGQCGYKVGHCRLAAPPEDLHQPQFGFGERVGFLRRHRYLIESMRTIPILD